MKSVLALSALLFARAVFAQDSLASVSTTSAAASSDSLVSVSSTDSSSIASSTPASVSASITGSSSSASHTGSAKAKGTSSSAAPAATGASYKIPSGISADCSTFMKKLDTDEQFGACTAPLLKATANFSPGSSAAQNQNALISTLNNLCSATGCPDKYIRTQLTNFATACSNELDPSSGNKAVRDAYDILYVMQPWQDAICTKDTDGSYCAVKAPSKSSTSTSSSDDKTGAVVNAVTGGSDADFVNDAIDEFYSKGVDSVTLRKRAQQTIYTPDTEAYRNSGVMYLYTLPSLSADSLCTTCTQKVLSAYASWEATVPYAAGLSNSPMLGGQGELWTETKKKCGDSFMNVVTSSVGTANSERVNSGTQVSVSGAVAGVFAVAMGFFVAL